MLLASVLVPRSVNRSERLVVAAETVEVNDNGPEPEESMLLFGPRTFRGRLVVAPDPV